MHSFHCAKCVVTFFKNVLHFICTHIMFMYLKQNKIHKAFTTIFSFACLDPLCVENCSKKILIRYIGVKRIFL